MDGLFRRRNLPHLDVPGGTYFVTFCLAGSLPASGTVARVRRQRDRPATLAAARSPADWQRRHAAAAFAAVDRLLDEAPAVDWLADPLLAEVVRRSLLHGHGRRYELLSYVVMPSHCHMVFSPLADTIGGRPAREVILHSLKRHTSHRCNQLLGRNGAFWQAESYERLVRGPRELDRVIHYVERNPVKAGLCGAAESWMFSSAHARPRPLDPHSAG